jgi:hypothetical protein
LKAPKTFHERTLWPEFQSLSAELKKHLRELTEQVIREAIHDDITEAPEAGSPKALPSSTMEGDQEESDSGSVAGDKAGSPT